MKHNPIPKQHELDKEYLKQKVEKIHKLLIKNTKKS
jgi:pseudouridine-5'-phosphate glycosidase